MYIYMINYMYILETETEVEAAQAFDIASIKLKGDKAITNFDIANYDVETILKTKHKIMPEEEDDNEENQIVPRPEEEKVFVLPDLNLIPDSHVKEPETDNSTNRKGGDIMVYDASNSSFQHGSLVSPNMSNSLELIADNYADETERENTKRKGKEIVTYDESNSSFQYGSYSPFVPHQNSQPTHQETIQNDLPQIGYYDNNSAPNGSSAPNQINPEICALNWENHHVPKQLTPAFGGRWGSKSQGSYQNQKGSSEVNNTKGKSVVIHDDHDGGDQTYKDMTLALLPPTDQSSSDYEQMREASLALIEFQFAAATELNQRSDKKRSNALVLYEHDHQTDASSIFRPPKRPRSEMVRKVRSVEQLKFPKFSMSSTSRGAKQPKIPKSSRSTSRNGEQLPIRRSPRLASSRPAYKV